MTMTLTQIKDFARAQVLQTDATDLPDALLDAFAREGVSRVLNRVGNWPHLQKSWTFSTVANQHPYTLTSISADLDVVMGVIDETSWGVYLDEIDYQEAKMIWVGTADYTDHPRYYSLFEARLWLWPKPNNVRTLTVIGQRTPAVLTAASDVPDLPAYFHESIAYFVTAMAYAQQEDPATQQMWQTAFEQSVAVGIEKTFKQRGHRPVIINGERFVGFRTYEGWMNAMARG